MCNCAESALEDEPEIRFVTEDGEPASWGTSLDRYDTTPANYNIVGVRLEGGSWCFRPRITFKVRESA